MNAARQEFDYIRWVREQTPTQERVLIGPGDDCALFQPRTSSLLITTDMLMDGVDFLVNEVDPVRIGRKALAVNLSDIAAMAGVPTTAVVSVALPRGRNLAEPLYQGMRTLADEFSVAIVGGDTNSWDGPLVISITVLGEPTPRGAVPRSGAKPGDWIFVTGPCGGSLLGHHLDFTPRVREALRLQESCDLHAMIDISDGLSADLGHILEESGCGAVLTAEAIPVSSAASEMAKTSGKSALEHALGDGEDFELIFVVSQEDGERLQQSSPVPVWKIGECVNSGLWLETAGKRQTLLAHGWKHAL